MNLIRYILLAGFIMKLFGCTSPISDDIDLRNRLIGCVKESDGQTIRLDTITNFDWDEVYLFFPYVHINKVLEIESKVVDLNRTNVRTLTGHEGITGFAFVKEGMLVRYTTIPRASCCNIISEGLPGFLNMKRKDAVFEVKDQRLYPIRISKENM